MKFKVDENLPVEVAELLREYSLRPPRAQATCRGGRCRQCGALVLFRGDSDPSSHV